MILAKLKYIFVLFIFTCCFPVAETSAETKGQVLIINQVRGEECCDKGNFDNLKSQVESHISYQVPATFVLRYDALENTKYSAYLKKVTTEYPDLIKIGILLEITPNLANNAGVAYNASDDRWFDAKNVYSIGYSDDENRKMADHIFEKYNSIFGQYPQVSTSWMIDTNLLNYISDQYGIKVHQTTREQWALDSYTLYGGPPHYPYPASKNWGFIPDFERENGPLVVRQTLTDPLYTYGDKTSSYTSQPNDFTINKTFDYYNNLIHQALFEQVGQGFALIGLENSMDKKYHHMYTDQIKQLKEFQNRELINFPEVSTLVDFWKKQKVTVYQGKDLVKSAHKKAYWITTSKYRIRIRQDDQKLLITDLRLYDRNFIDPYISNEAQRNGYWVVPFLIDGSITKPELVKTFFTPPMPENNFSTVEHDVDGFTNGIELPEIANSADVQTFYSDDNITLVYKSLHNQDKKIIFKDKEIQFQGFSRSSFEYIENSEIETPVQYRSGQDSITLYWNIHNNKLIEATMDCSKNECTLGFSTNPQFLRDAFKENYTFLFPEPVNHPVSKDKTILYSHNKYAISGRNPSRIIVFPYDRYGNITSLSRNKIRIKIDSSVKYELLTLDNSYYIDFYSNTPGIYSADILLGDDIEKKKQVIFAPNCKKDIIRCILNPRFSWWYVNTIFGDKKRQILLGE